MIYEDLVLTVVKFFYMKCLKELEQISEIFMMQIQSLLQSL